MTDVKINFKRCLEGYFIFLKRVQNTEEGQGERCGKSRSNGGMTRTHCFPGCKVEFNDNTPLSDPILGHDDYKSTWNNSDYTILLCHVLLATILLRDDEPTSLSESRWENADVGGKLRALRIGGLMRTKLVEHQPEYFSNLLAIGTSSTFDYCIKTKIGFRNFGLLLENGMQGPQAPLLIPVVVVKRTEVK